jgi:hypothetical protein
MQSRSGTAEQSMGAHSIPDELWAAAIKAKSLGAIASEDDSIGMFHYISCSGPDYANSVSVKPTSGDSSVNATFNPTSPGCYGYNVFAPVTISVTGQFNGIYQDSQTGIDKSTSNGTSFKSNFTSDFFTETFTGTIGFASGPFSGNANTSRRNERTQVK